MSGPIASLGDPDPCGPCGIDGVPHAPAVCDRVFRGCDDVVAHIAQVEVTRGMGDRDVTGRAGVGPDALARLVREGRGDLPDFPAVNEALGVRAHARHLRGLVVTGPLMCPEPCRAAITHRSEFLHKDAFAS